MTAFFVRCGKIVKHAYLIFTKKKKLPAYRAKSISPFVVDDAQSLLEPCRKLLYRRTVFNHKFLMKHVWLWLVASPTDRLRRAKVPAARKQLYSMLKVSCMRERKI